MKIKSNTVRVRRRGGENNAKSSRRPTTRVSTRGMNPYTSGKPPAKGNKHLVYIGLASCFAFFLFIVIIIAVNSGGSGKPVQTPRPQVTNNANVSPKKKRNFGAKYAPYDPRMVMTEESEMAKARKKRRLKSGK